MRARWMWIPLGLSLLAAGCAGHPPRDASPPRDTSPPDAPASPAPSLLAALYFYHGHTVGKANAPTGLHETRDQGASWASLTWPELISNSVAVDPSGRFVYLAAGNGVMVSADGGRSFRLTGGWEMTEVQRVAIDRRDPRKAWAATAYGVFSSTDVMGAGNAWKKAPHEDLFRYCSDIVQDPADPDTLWIASEVGVFVSRDGARTFTPSGPRVRVRRVTLDRARPGHLWAATDGEGLLASADGGASWQRVPGSPDVVFCVEPGPSPGSLACGSTDGVWTRESGAASFTRRELPEAPVFVFDAAYDPADPRRLFVSGTDGVFSSRDGGASFERSAFAGAIVPDLVFATLARDAGAKRAHKPGSLVIPGLAERFDEHRPAPDPAFEERRREVLTALAEQQGGSPRGYFGGVGPVRDGTADEAFFKELLAQLESPPHSMFFSMPALALYLHARDELPPAVRERLRTLLTTHPVYRGDTENHWVMHYAVSLLAAQTWPETSASEWYTGQSTQELYDEARGWLLHWAQLTATKGQGEFDSPIYMFMYVTPMLLLYDFAKEPAIRQLAGMMLDLLLADYLTESLSGAYCGGHSRIVDREVQLGTDNRVSSYHYLFSGGIERPKKIHGWLLAAAYSSYRPPAMLQTIANRRATPFVHTERKRVRNVIRFGPELNPPVSKYLFMTPAYGLGSLQGGILQPIQQHTWDLTWKGSAANTTLFSLHPYFSARELGMFFPEEVHFLTQSVSAQKASYASPDKLVSSSPYEKVFQRQNNLLALYQVAPGERFPHVQLYWPDCLERTEREGWLFGKDGDLFVACYPCQPGEWLDFEGYALLRCNGKRAGFVVVARPADTLGDPTPAAFEAFQKQVVSGGPPTLTGEGDQLTLSFRAADGRVLDRVWGEPRGKVDGHSPSKEPWQYRGPFLQGAPGSGIVTFTDGRAKRILDFNHLTIEVEPE